jgi:hypothetical protein
MEKKEFLMMLAEQYGIKIDPGRAERMAQAGGPLDLVLYIRSLLFRIDVSGYRPEDTPSFDPKEMRL